MPVSSEENFQEKLLIFNDWLKNKERYRGEDISVSPHNHLRQAGFLTKLFLVPFWEKTFVKILF